MVKKIEVQFKGKRNGPGKTGYLLKAIFPFLLLLTVTAGIYAQGTEPYAPSVPGDEQLYTTEVPPSVMLVMSKDHKLFYKAYTDYADLNGDGHLDTTYDHDIEYYGYFDGNKCYEYDSGNGLFSPTRVDTRCNRDGRVNEWSGNFLNWASMAGIDALRKVLYGGYRSIDNDGLTVLERTFIPQDAHSWVKVYSPEPDDTIHQVPIEWLTPYSGVTTISLCNTTLDSYGNPPVMRVAGGDWIRWASSERWQCACEGEKNTDYDYLRPNKTDELLGEYNVRVKVCVDGLLGSEKCREYENGNIKPVGLLQTFGETDRLFFGLITGSYTKNKSGGVLRKNIGTVTDEIDLASGKFTNVQGIVKTLNSMEIVRYCYSGCGEFDGTYSPAIYDDCPSGLGSDFTEGRCKNWGNPIGEMYYEALRYFSGKPGPTEAYAANDSSIISGLNPVPWVDPYNETNYCSKPYILVISDLSPSFDSDQLPGSYFSNFTGDISGLTDVEALTNKIGDYENLMGNYFIGQKGVTRNGLCTEKAVDKELGEVRGLCPEEPDRKGSYYLAGLAHWAKTNDLRQDRDVPKVNTYSVVLSSPLPEIKIPLGGSVIKVIPAAYNFTHKNNATLVHFMVLSQTATSGKFYMSWEDSEQGGDYDMDMDGYLYYDVSGDKITFRVEVTNSSTPFDMGMGYVVSGTQEDGVFYPAYNHPAPWDTSVDGSRDDFISNLTCLMDAGRSLTTDFYDRSDNQTGYWWPDDGADEVYNEASWFCGLKTHTVGTSSASFLKDPLWYAAKWGGFNDLDDDGIPSLQSEWDGDGDGVPDNYYFVTNPLELENRLNQSFTDIISRAVSHVVPVVSVDEADRTQSGDNLYMTFFKPIEARHWQGNLKKYGLDFRVRTDCNRTEPEWTVVDRNGNTAGNCDGTFKVNTMSYWSTENDGGFLEKGGAGEVMARNQLPTDSEIENLALTVEQFHGFRNIYTYKSDLDPDGNGLLTPFKRPRISRSDLNVADDTARDKVINFVYGYTFDTRGETAYPVKKREWILGDIIHSEPLIIDYFGAAGDLDRRFIAIGSNDGMLHVFTDNEVTLNGRYYPAGAEVFAFIPGDLLPKLAEFGDPSSHPVMVDGSANLFRASTKTANGYHHKTLVFGQRRGGRSYWALDVSDPDPVTWKAKWHIQGGTGGVDAHLTRRIEELGYTWSKPFFTTIKIGDNNLKNVMLFAGGYDPDTEDGFPEGFADTNNNGIRDEGETHTDTIGGTDGYDTRNPGSNIMGQGIFVVDLDDGITLFKATFAGSGAEVTNGIDQRYSAMKYCFPADISVVPFSETELKMYVADIYGQIWKIAYNYSAQPPKTYFASNSNKWTVKRIFAANPGSDMPSGDAEWFKGENSNGPPALADTDSGRKTFYSPDVSYFGNEWTSRPVLYFGTGDRAHPRYRMIKNRFYVVADYDRLTYETDLLNLTCGELNEDADPADEQHKADLVNLLLDGSARGFYRVMSDQGNCVDDDTDHTGEHVLSQPTLFFKNVFFTTYQPVYDDPCNPVGNAFIYVLDYSYGTSAFNFDTINDIDGKIRNVADSYLKISGSSIPSSIRIITRGGETAGLISAGGGVSGVGEEQATRIPGPPGGASQLTWETGE